jgi:hypothetical protein
MGFSTNVDGSVNMNYIGAGSGDMLAANNLSDLANKQAAVTNLGLAGVSGSVTRVENTTNQYCRTNENRDVRLSGNVGIDRSAANNEMLTFYYAGTKLGGISNESNKISFFDPVSGGDLFWWNASNGKDVTFLGPIKTPAIKNPSGNSIDTTNLFNIVNGGVVTTSALQSATAGLANTQATHTASLTGLSATQAQNTAAIAALQQVTVFGATNAHPVLGTNYASFVSTLPATAWTNTYSVPSNGTYLVGNRFETNSVTNIVSGDYVHNVWTEVNSANTLGYYYSVLVAISASSNVTVLGTGANIFPSTLRVSHSSTIHMQTNTVFTNAVYRGVLRYFVRTGGTPGSTFSIFGGDGYDTKLTRGVSFDETTDAQTLQGYTPQTLMQQTVYTVYTNDPALTNVNISLANGYHQVFAGTQPLQVVNLPDISGYAGQQVKLRIDMRPGTNALTTTGMAGQVRLSAGWTITNSTTIPSRTLWDKSALETNWTGAVINL